MFATKAFVIAAFCLTATLATTPFSPCKAGPTPLRLRVKGCNGDTCIFYRGTTVQAEWDFKVAAETGDLRPVVMVTFSEETIPYMVPEQNACNSLKNHNCPLHKDEEVTYNLNMPIAANYPKTDMGFEFTLIDSKNVVHSCFQLRAKIADK